jgi:hypothetical protein
MQSCPDSRGGPSILPALVQETTGLVELYQVGMAFQQPVGMQPFQVVHMKFKSSGRAA